MTPTTRLVGVYRADGGLVGELRYLVGHYLRGESCTLCDITHSPWRRKAEWDAEAASLAMPFDLLHLNELDPDLAEFVGDRAACVVLEQASDGAVDRTLLITNDELAEMDGSVAAFFTLLRERASPPARD